MPRKGQTINVISRLEANSYDKGLCEIWMGKTTGKVNGYGEIWYKGTFHYGTQNLNVPKKEEEK